MADRLSDSAGRGRWQRLRRMLMVNWQAQRATCFFCGGELCFTIRHPDPRAVEAHHVIPVSVAPQFEYDPGNIRPSHRLCNSLGQAAFGPDDDTGASVPDTGFESERW